MRIGVIGPNIPDSFAFNIIDALSAMGHTPVWLGSAFLPGASYTSAAIKTIQNLVPSLDVRAQRRIVRAAHSNECEAIINVDQRLWPDVVEQLRLTGAKVALWFPDALLNMGRQLMLLAPYNAIFVKEPHLVERLRPLLDLPIYYLPEACNSRLHRPLAAPATEPYLVIAGNMYPSRIRLLQRLMAEGIPLRLYGPGFPRWVAQTPLRQVHAGRAVVGTEKAQIFRSATAVLNNLHPAEICGVNARLFEAAGSGAAVLTEYRPALAELFAIGDEVLAFRDFDELVKQARRLISEASLSGKLGDAAAQRAHECHTYEKRLTVVLERLF